MPRARDMPKDDTYDAPKVEAAGTHDVMILAARDFGGARAIPRKHDEC